MDVWLAFLVCFVGGEVKRKVLLLCLKRSLFATPCAAACLGGNAADARVLGMFKFLDNQC
jgi:hypothetical protein